MTRQRTPAHDGGQPDNFHAVTASARPQTTLLSHTTARPRQAGTSFESQTPKPGRQAAQEPSPTGTPQRYGPGSLPSRPGPQRLRTIRRLGARSPRPCPSLSVACYRRSRCGVTRPWRSWWARRPSMLLSNGAAVASRSRLTRARPMRLLMSFQTAWAGAGSGEVPGWALFLRLPACSAGCGSFMACALARCRGEAWLKKGLPSSK